MSPATRVSVLLAQLEKRNDSTGRYEVVEWFVPVGLDWCHGIGPELPAINSRSAVFFDLGNSQLTAETLEKYFAAHYGEPDLKQFVLKTSRIDATSARYVLGKGAYRLRIQVSAADAAPIEALFDFHFSPGWSADVDELRRDWHTRLVLLGQCPQSLFGATREQLRRAMEVDLGLTSRRFISRDALALASARLRVLG
jgi:hypothetical protein